MQEETIKKRLTRELTIGLLEAFFHPTKFYRMCKEADWTVTPNDKFDKFYKLVQEDFGDGKLNEKMKQAKTKKVIYFYTRWWL